MTHPNQKNQNNITYHRVKVDSRQNRVYDDCDQVGVRPGSVDENFDVFCENVNKLGVFFLFYLPLFEAASEVEEPALDFSLYKSEVVVHVQVVVATYEQLHYSEPSEPNKQLNARVLDVAVLFEVINDRFKQINRAEGRSLQHCQHEAVVDDTVYGHSFYFTADKFALTFLKFL